MNPKIYDSPEFEQKYTYSGNDLGAVWSKEKTAFRLWAPTAQEVYINLYKSGNVDARDMIGQFPMRPDAQGTWFAAIAGDLNGVYYTYLVTVGGVTSQVCDPYARTTGVNGRRAMILDLSSTNPTGWDQDSDPNAGLAITDTVIYELHVRDLSTDPHSGIRNVGKFLGLTEKGTKTPTGIPTGLDHIKSLGITHLHLLPVYDYGSVDETRLDIPQFNWGYDPVNFNVPEGSYSTDPFHGEVRVKEMKQMIQCLHDNGISVIMDVVYNHVYDGGSFCFNRVVPQYFSRTDSKGRYSNGSGCGNDTASERSMVRKYIVDSVKYWADEYHIDGFRFDLVGLIDTDTINELMWEVKKDHPHVIFYGEGWNMDTWVTRPGVQLTTQTNSRLVPGFAFFNDTIRDTLKGSVFYHDTPGFVTGAVGQEDLVAKCFLGKCDWCPDPVQTVNYVSCHDNMSLQDRISSAVGHAPEHVLIRMNKLAAAIYLLSQGIPFFQAGEEFMRVKRTTSGMIIENSYNAPDSVNCIKWMGAEEHSDVVEYYRGLLRFRKANPLLRLRTAADVEKHVKYLGRTAPSVIAFLAQDEHREIFFAFNGSTLDTSVALPQGKWDVCVDHTHAGTVPLATVSGSVALAGISALVLVREK